MSKHLIVISVDALVFEDLEYARNLPAFQSLLERGSIVERITTVYPSSTHPVHASIITGVPTGDTGIICNKKIFKDLDFRLQQTWTEKRWAGRSTSWNQDCREKYQ